VKKPQKASILTIKQGSSAVMILPLTEIPYDTIAYNTILACTKQGEGQQLGLHFVMPLINSVSENCVQLKN